MSQYFVVHPVNRQKRLIHQDKVGTSCEHSSYPAEPPAMDGGAGNDTRDGS
jgi:hypothetical protein